MGEELRRTGIAIVRGNPPHILFANPAMTEISGYPFNDLISLSPEEIESLIYPEEREVFFRGYQNCLDGKPTVSHYEVRGIRKDGETRWLELSLTAIEHDGQPAVRVTFVDIHERKQAEEVLRRSEAKLSFLMETSAAGIFVLHGNKLLYCNRSAEVISGYTQEELLEMDHMNIVHPDFREVVRDHEEARMKGQPVPSRYEVKIITKRGEERWVDFVPRVTEFDGKKVLFVSFFDITERKRAETKLNEANARLQMLQQVIASVHSTLDLEKVFKQITDGFVYSLGFMSAVILGLNDRKDHIEVRALSTRQWILNQLDHVIGFSFKDHSFPFRSGLNATAQAVMDGKIVVARTATEVAYPLINKATCTVLQKLGGIKNYIVVPLLVGNETVGGVLITSSREEVSEEELEMIRVFAFAASHAIQNANLLRQTRQAEEALRESEDRYRDLVEHSQDLICTHDLEGRILSVNQGALKALGYDQRALLRMKNIRDILASEVRGEFDSYSATIRTEGVARGLMLVQTSKGEKRIWEYHNTLRTEGVPTPIVRGVAHDITERLSAEKALKASEEKYRTLFEESKDAIFITTPDGKIIDINPAGVELFGYASKEELLKSNIREDLYVHPENRDELERLLATQGYVKDFELVLKRKDGEKLIVLETATAVKDGEGAVTAYRGILRDVTAQRSLEAQFLQSQKMEAVGLLAGGVAHDFNNLLTVILGNAEFGLMDIEPTHPHYEIFSKIREGAKRASGFTQQLLAFSRRQMLQPKVLNVAELISNLSKMLSRLIGEDIELKMEFGPGLGHIYADPSALDQMLMNLVVNARDAMPRGGVLTIQAQTVWLDEAFCRLHPYAEPGEYVLISMIDTGVGMDENTLQRIFEPFFTTRERGTGLGLSVVYGIVKQHKGHIFVSSQPGKGSRFDVYFSVYKGSVLQEAMEVLKEDIPRGIETLLIAEDEREVRELFRTFLEGLGYSVLLAGDGEEALGVFQTHRDQIDLIILDAVMPKLGGPKVYEFIHARSPDLPCLFLTGYSEEILQRYFDQDLKVPVLRKPVTFQELGQKVREVLDQRAGIRNHIDLF